MAKLAQSAIHTDSKAGSSLVVQNPDTPLTERQQVVLATMVMRHSEIEALAYCTGQGFEMSRTVYYREIKIIKNSAWKRAEHISKSGFLEQHMTRIDQLRQAEHELWKNYKLEQSHFKKALIVKTIIELQPYLSSAYGLTQRVVERQIASQGTFAPPKLPKPKKEIKKATVLKTET